MLLNGCSEVTALIEWNVSVRPVYLALCIYCEGIRERRWLIRAIRPSQSSLGLEQFPRAGWGMSSMSSSGSVGSSLTFHLFSSCGKCHFKSGERCSLDWVASRHICQLAETARLWLGDEAVLGHWTSPPAVLKWLWLAVNLMESVLVFM